MRLFKIVAVLMVVALLMCVSLKGFSEGGSEHPFTVAPVYPGNQVEAEAGYWYVDAVAGKSQDLTTSVRNLSGKDMTVDVEAADCYTSTGGDLCYITDNSSPLVSLTDKRFMLAKNISLPVKSLKLKAGETKLLRFTVKAPDIEAGEVLGGVRFSVTTPGQKPGAASGGGNAQLNLNIRNAVTITVRLRYKTPGNLGKPGFSIGDAGFDSDYGAAYFSIVNLLPQINRDARGSYDVYDSGNKRLFGGSFDMVRMAPVSEVRFPVKWNYPSAGPGKYSVHVTVQNASSPEIRSFQLGSGDEVTITETEPPGAAPQPAGATPDNRALTYGGWILFAITVVFTVIFLFIKRRRKRGEEK